MPKPQPAGSAQRRNELAAIHMLAAQLGMDTKDPSPESDYHSMLWTIGRQLSSAKLDYAGRHRVLDHLRKRVGGEWEWVNAMPASKRPMLWKIRRLCINIGIRAGGQVVYAEGAATRIAGGVPRKLRMMEGGELYALTGALNNTYKNKRAGIKTDEVGK